MEKGEVGVVDLCSNLTLEYEMMPSLSNFYGMGDVELLGRFENLEKGRLGFRRGGSEELRNEKGEARETARVTLNKGLSSFCISWRTILEDRNTL